MDTYSDVVKDIISKNNRNYWSDFSCLNFGNVIFITFFLSDFNQPNLSNIFFVIIQIHKFDL